MPLFKRRKKIKVKDLNRVVDKSVENAIANKYPELEAKNNTIPKEVIELFEAFDSKDGKYNARAIASAAKNISDKVMKELYESVNWESETGALLSKKISRTYKFKTADITTKGTFPTKFDTRKCICDETLYKEWYEVIRKIHCCCCCHRRWPVIYPYPICKYCWRCRMVKIYHTDGSFYAHSLEFSDKFNVTENPTHRAEIDVIGGGSSGPINWSDIDFTGSNITNIANRSHTALTDIGTQTHAQIDSHLSANSAHGTTGNVVGDSDSQTLSNKTLDTPVINNTLSGSALKDDATFSSVAGNTIASTASIKSYVDTAVASSSGGVTIDDSVTNLTQAWSSQKIKTELDTKADTSALSSYATIDDSVTNLTQAWSSQKIDTELSTKANTSDLSSFATINDAATNLTETWSSQKMSDLSKVIKGNYYGGPAYAAGTPFRFNINTLGTGLDPANIFVEARGFKTDAAGNLQNALQIEWNVVLDSTDLVVELTVRDENGNLYQDPGSFGAWNGCKVKLHFFARDNSEVQTATFIP